MVSEIPLTDEFDHPQGRLTYYDAYDLTEQKAIAAQKHVDIRRFIQEDETIGGNVLSLDSNTIQTMNGYTMGNVSSGERLLAINRITNPSAEVNATSGGITASNATIARTTTVANVGSASFQLTSVAAGNMSWRHLNDRFAVIAGEAYSAAAEFRAATTARSCRVYLDWYDSAGVRIGSPPVGSNVTNTTTGWTRAIVENRIAPTGAVTAQVIAEVAATGAANEVHYVDAVIAHQGTTVFDYFDGSITAPANRRVRWTGTAHASTSELIDTTSGGLLVTAIAGEKWTAGTVGKQSDLRNWRGLSMTLANGTNTTASVTTPVDLDTDFTNADFISLALPTLPLNSITPATSFVDFTSNANGDFTAGPTDSIALSATTVPLVAGDSEFRVPRSALTTVNKAAITGVRLRITGAGVTNRITNSSFESGAVAPWALSSGDTATVSTTWAKYGTRSARVNLTRTDGSAVVFQMSGTDHIAVTPGEQFAFAADVNIVDAPGDGIRIDLLGYAADNTTLTGENPIGATFTGTGETRLTVTGTVGANTHFFRPRIRIDFATGTDSVDVYIDGIIFVRGTNVVPPFFNGDTPGYIWNGTQYASTSTARFRAMALRLLSTDWKYAPVDVDTRYKRLIQTVAPNGSLTRAYDQRYGILWRSSSPPGIGDLQPVDTSMGIVFNSGSMTDTNSFSIYLREKIGVDFLTQLDLNTTPQSELNGNEQPDIGVGKYQPRPQTDLDLYPQSALDPETQTELERMADVLAASWVSATIQWKPSGLTTFILGNSENTVSSGSTHQIDFPGLQPNTRYMVYVDLEEHTFRVRLYALTRNEQVGALLMDSTAITDDFFFKRRKGRIGFDTQFRDGDVYIEGIRSRGSVFAEYRSAPMTSITPVEGAELYVEGSSSQELVKGLEAGPFGGSLSFDTAHTLSGRSTRVANPSGLFGQGVQTNLIQFENFADYELNLDLYYPSGSTALLDFYLISETANVIQLDLPNINVDRWEHFKIDLAQIKNEVNGAYRLVIIDSRPGITGGWWIEGVSIKRRIINWSGRADTGDPWVDTPGDWTPFQNLVNRQRAGILFHKRGDTLQVRAQAVHPSATISRIRIIPRYASLGRFSWLDQRSQGERPTALWTYTNDGGGAATVTFNGSTSTAIGQIIDYHWNFGDGTTGSGVISKHTYLATGTFTASLTVTDDRGRQNTRMEVIVVT